MNDVNKRLRYIAHEKLSTVVANQILDLIKNRILQIGDKNYLQRMN